MKDHPLHCAGNNNSIIGSLNHSIVPSKNDGDIKTFVAISAKSITIVGDMEIPIMEFQVQGYKISKNLTKEWILVRGNFILFWNGMTASS